MTELAALVEANKSTVSRVLSGGYPSGTALAQRITRVLRERGIDPEAVTAAAEPPATRADPPPWSIRLGCTRHALDLAQTAADPNQVAAVLTLVIGELNQIRSEIHEREAD